MDVERVKVWVCKRGERRSKEAFVTRDPETVRDARRRGFRCTRWHGMER